MEGTRRAGRLAEGLASTCAAPALKEAEERLLALEVRVAREAEARAEELDAALHQVRAEREDALTRLAAALPEPR